MDPDRQADESFLSSTVGNKRLTRHSTLTETIITYTKPSVEDELLIALSRDGQRA